jgi:hypothetical protein
MKKILFILCFFLISFTSMAQKVTIRVLSTPMAGVSDWQILDDQSKSVFSGLGSSGNDSVTFSLDANKYYFLKISVADMTIPDTILFTLILNNEPLLLIKTDVGRGEHLFPFFTGVRGVNAKITGGATALISDFPWQVYYISGNFRCGGSIINGNWVITAAHCTKNSTGGAISASEMFVRVGLNNPSSSLDGKTYSVSQAIVHEGFDSQSLLNDIALLKLKDTINFLNATPINLITPDDVASGAIVPGVMSWVTGWGLTGVSPNVVPTSLQKVQLPVISRTQASTVWSSIPATDLMAGYLNGNKDACNGDSGGPLVVPASGEYRLAGIVSWGSASCNTYGAYTRVSDFGSWILKNTGFAPAGDSIVCQGVVSGSYSIAPIPGSTAYQWVLLPAGAGVITGSGRKATVVWNKDFSGGSTIIVKATINNKISDWYRLHVTVALNTKLLGQTADTIICAGKPVTLNVSAAGYHLIYKWSKNGVVLQSGTSSKYNISGSTINDSGDYRYEISGSCGTLLSGTIKLVVYPVTKISFISPDVEVPFGNNTTLQVKADGHDLSYQWQKDGIAIENSNSASLSLLNLNATDIGIYKTTVTGTCGIEISDTIYLYVKRANFSTEPEVFLWPSVTSEEFTIALSTDSFYNVQIFNTMGKKFREQTNCRYQTRFNVSTMAKGIYIVEVYNKDFRKSIKVIKE